MSVPLHASRPSNHVYANLESPKSPQFPDQAPPLRQQLARPLLLVPHLGHVAVCVIDFVVALLSVGGKSELVIGRGSVAGAAMLVLDVLVVAAVSFVVAMVTVVVGMAATVFVDDVVIGVIIGVVVTGKAAA